MVEPRHVNRAVGFNAAEGGIALAFAVHISLTVLVFIGITGMSLLFSLI